MLFYYEADDMTENALINYDDDTVLPMAREWVKNKVTSISYNDSEPFFYFLDKYMTIIVGGQQAMDKFYKDNPSKMIFDKLMALDIVYSVLVYKSANEVWREKIKKSQECKTAEEWKAFAHTAVLKYHVQ